jgi:NADPH:quinone reductase-like Zn-dependent oxidoreductase
LAMRAPRSSSALRARALEDKAAIVASVRDHVWPLLADGVVRPVIADRLPLAEAGRAHTVLAESQHVGKVLLTTGAPAPRSS